MNTSNDSSAESGSYYVPEFGLVDSVQPPMPSPAETLCGVQYIPAIPPDNPQLRVLLDMIEECFADQERGVPAPPWLEQMIASGGMQEVRPMLEAVCPITFTADQVLTARSDDALERELQEQAKTVTDPRARFLIQFYAAGFGVPLLPPLPRGLTSRDLHKPTDSFFS